MTKPIFLLMAAAVTLLAAAVRSIDLMTTLEYDEIWSLVMYAPLPAAQIITDLSLPNNHPLNSLYLKLFSAGAPPAWLRLHTLIAGIAAVILTGILARRWFNSRRAGIFAMLMLAFSAPAAYYSAVARGYSLQLAALLLFTLSLHDLFTAKRHPRLAVCGVWIGGTAAILSVSSSAMFLLPVGLAALGAIGFGIRQRGVRFYLLPGITLDFFALAALGWYLFHREKLQQGLIWGKIFDSPGEYLIWMAGIVTALGIPLIMAVITAIPGLNRRNAKMWMPLLLAFLLPLLLAPITRGGPARVYLPLTAVFALLYGGTAAWLLHLLHGKRICRLLTAALLLIIPALLWRTALPRWRQTDWHQIHAAAETAPADTIIIYTATNNYPLVWNVPDAPAAANARMRHPMPRQLLLVNQHRGINGMTADEAEMVLTLPTSPHEPVGSLPAATVQLRPLTAEPAPGTVLLAILRPGSPAEKLDVVHTLRPLADPLLILNSRLIAAIDLQCGDQGPALLLFRWRPGPVPLLETGSARRGSVQFFEVTL